MKLHKYSTCVSLTGTQSASTTPLFVYTPSLQEAQLIRLQAPKLSSLINSQALRTNIGLGSFSSRAINNNLICMNYGIVIKSIEKIIKMMLYYIKKFF